MRFRTDECQTEVSERGAILAPEPGRDRDRQQEMSRIDQAAHVFEHVGVSEPAHRRLQDQGRLVAVEERAVESSQVVGWEAHGRREVAHDLVCDEEQNKRRPSPHEDHDPPVGQGSDPG